MKAIRLHAFGPPENLILEELPDLEPATGQVRIEVRASGVHLLDTTLRRGETGGPLPPPELPTVPGREVAGVVDRIGPGVDERWLHRSVVAHLGLVPGGYAGQAVTAVDTLFELPESLSVAEAVALVGTGRTAVGIAEAAAFGPDDVVLIPAAAGGIGWLLVQAAQTAGAKVIAAAGGPAKLDRLRELAPAQLVDYSRPDWADTVTAKPTVVLDGVGGATGRASLELLAPGGRLLMFGYSEGAPTQLTTDDLVARSLVASWSLGPPILNRPGGIRALAAEALRRGAGGEWQPLTTTYPLAEAARAHRDLEERRTVGKVVLLSD